MTKGSTERMRRVRRTIAKMVCAECKTCGGQGVVLLRGSRINPTWILCADCGPEAVEARLEASRGMWQTFVEGGSDHEGLCEGCHEAAVYEYEDFVRGHAAGRV